MVLLSAKTDSVSNLSNNTGSRNLRIVAHRADIQRFVFNPIDADGWKETIILFQFINVMINCCINVAEFVTVIWHADKKVFLLSKLSIHFTPITIITFVKYEFNMERKKKGENSYGKIFHILNLINRGDAIRGRK